MKKLLIISVSAGAGHVQIAKAIEEYAERDTDTWDVRHIDMMDYVSTPTRSAIVDLYDQMVRRIPGLWGHLYEVSDSGERLKWMDTFVKIYNQVNARKLYAFVRDMQPDVIVCTHAFPAQALRQSGDFDETPVFAMVTDYGVHSYWLMGDPDHFFVGSEDVRKQLVERGVNVSMITVTGIPVSQRFFEAKDRAALRKAYHIAPQKNVALVLAGGMGMIAADDIAERIAADLPDMQIIAIAGKNESLYKRLQSLAGQIPQLLAVGWTDVIDEYMCVADIIVGKPGGSTLSEAIALGKPFVSVMPIPGQEESNAQYMEHIGIGIIARKNDDIGHAITTCLARPQPMPLKKNPAEVVLDYVEQYVSRS